MNIRCTICGIDSPKKDVKLLPLCVIGSEGVFACMQCCIALANYAGQMKQLADKCRMAGYKACKEAHKANAKTDVLE